ncbi:RidA family protein [Paremcibacter congregatus]|uniref:Enamine deaminase RidA n=1 Tax=Paremcibacter congregatus TaxID=2043170 RepID=A0A2G4YP21_9PROT|nr:RidA family protein [Paremcibacter congregatus]PHZ84053.1 enamine deaminase RidA [Paremcibacter congregatus]QDE25886.1 RidA family protein [Paremcibacter congregatus]
MKHILPAGWARPKGYSNGIIAKGEVFFIAGVVGWNNDEVFESDNLVDQFRQALLNIRAILEAGNAGPEHITRMTWYVTEMDGYRTQLPEFGAIYKEIIGKNFPVMACVGVTALVERQAKIEIEVTAVL